MLYELATAPSIFQNMINYVIRVFFHKFVIAYIDHILIYSPDLPTYIGHVCLVLKILLQHQLSIKGEKYEF